jgi:hypothetical protein
MEWESRDEEWLHWFTTEAKKAGTARPTARAEFGGPSTKCRNAELD